MFNILVVEDEENVRKLMKRYLVKNEYNVLEACNGEEALEAIDKNQVDLIITDIMMPKVDGYELTRELREANYTIPILIVTAKDTIDDKTIGFLSGADDYMVKPINMQEMLLRVKSLLKRANIINEKRMKIGNVVLDYNTLSVSKADEKFILKPKEFYILYKLLSYPDRIFTRQDLMEEFWDIDSESDPRTVDTHIKRIREKIKNIEEFDIETIRGLGYKGVINDSKK